MTLCVVEHLFRLNLLPRVDVAVPNVQSIGQVAYRSAVGNTSVLSRCANLFANTLQEINRKERTVEGIGSLMRTLL